MREKSHYAQCKIYAENSVPLNDSNISFRGQLWRSSAHHVLIRRKKGSSTKKLHTKAASRLTGKTGSYVVNNLVTYSTYFCQRSQCLIDLPVLPQKAGGGRSQVTSKLSQFKFDARVINKIEPCHFFSTCNSRAEYATKMNSSWLTWVPAQIIEVAMT